MLHHPQVGLGRRAHLFVVGREQGEDALQSLRRVLPALRVHGVQRLAETELGLRQGHQRDIPRIAALLGEASGLGVAVQQHEHLDPVPADPRDQLRVLRFRRRAGGTLEGGQRQPGELPLVKRVALQVARDGQLPVPPRVLQPRRGQVQPPPPFVHVPVAQLEETRPLAGVREARSPVRPLEDLDGALVAASSVLQPPHRRPGVGPAQGCPGAVHRTIRPPEPGPGRLARGGRRPRIAPVQVDLARHQVQLRHQLGKGQVPQGDAGQLQELVRRPRPLLAPGDPRLLQANLRPAPLQLQVVEDRQGLFQMLLRGLPLAHPVLQARQGHQNATLLGPVPRTPALRQRLDQQFPGGLDLASTRQHVGQVVQDRTLVLVAPAPPFDLHALAILLLGPLQVPQVQRHVAQAVACHRDHVAVSPLLPDGQGILGELPGLLRMSQLELHLGQVEHRKGLEGRVARRPGELPATLEVGQGVRRTAQGAQDQPEQVVRPLVLRIDGHGHLQELACVGVVFQLEVGHGRAVEHRRDRELLGHSLEVDRGLLPAPAVQVGHAGLVPVAELTEADQIQVIAHAIEGEDHATGVGPEHRILPAALLARPRGDGHGEAGQEERRPRGDPDVHRSGNIARSGSSPFPRLTPRVNWRDMSGGGGESPCVVCLPSCRTSNRGAGGSVPTNA